MSKKPSGELRASKSRNETIAEIGAGAVIAGLVCEVVLAAAFRDPNKSWLEEWGPVIADFLVAAGVAVEVWFGRRALSDADALVEDANNTAALALLTSNNSVVEAGNANLKAAQAEVQAAEARERAGKLDKEAADARGRVADLERLTAWRHISPEQNDEISSALRHMADSIRVLIEYERADPEACSYSYEIANIFSSLGVKNIRWGPNSFIGAEKFGLHATSEAEINLSSIRGIFEKAKAPVAEMGMTLGLKLTSPGERPNLYFFVGTKPPPFFREMKVEETASPTRLSETVELAERLDAQLSPRVLSSEQQIALVGALQAGGPGMVKIWFAKNDLNSQSYASQLYDSFREADWTAHLVAAAYSDIRAGVIVAEEPLGSMKPGQAAMERVLAAAGILFSVETFPIPTEESSLKQEGAWVSPVRGRLFIGQKEHG